MNGRSGSPGSADGAPEIGGLVVDLGLLLGVAATLVGIHFGLSPEARDALALDHARALPHTLLTSAYVHLDAAHLTGNVTGYAIGAALVYGLCRGTARLRWFRATFVAFLTVLPVAVNGVTLLAFDVAGAGAVVSRGFSGIVAGFGGFLLLAVVAFLGERYGRWTTVYTGFLLALVVLGEMLWLVADSVPALGAWALAVGVVITTGWLANRWRRVGAPPTADAWLRVTGDATVVVGVALVLSWFVLSLFPTQPLADGVVTNVLAHATGWFLGAGIAGGIHVLLPASPGVNYREETERGGA